MSLALAASADASAPDLLAAFSRCASASETAFISASNFARSSRCAIPAAVATFHWEAICEPLVVVPTPDACAAPQTPFVASESAVCASLPSSWTCSVLLDRTIFS